MCSMCFAAVFSADPELSGDVGTRVTGNEEREDFLLPLRELRSRRRLRAGDQPAHPRHQRVGDDRLREVFVRSNEESGHPIELVRFLA
jgi:hypothetical protein